MTPPKRHDSKKRPLSAGDFAYMHSMQKMAAVLSEEPLLTLSHESSDALLAACNIIGYYTGISFPSTIPTAQGDDVRIRLEELCRLSHARVREVTFAPDWWKSKGEPLLAFLGPKNHPVAIIPAEMGHEVIDPVARTRRRVDESILGMLYPIGYTFYKPFNAEVKSKETLGLLWRGQLTSILSLVIVGFLGALLGLASPFLMRIVFDQVIPDNDYRTFFQIIAGLLLAASGIYVFGIVRAFIILRLEGLVEVRLKAALWDRILKLPLKFFHKYPTGDLIQRAMIVEHATAVVSSSTINLMVSTVFGLIYLIPMFYFSVPLTFVSLAILGLGALISAIYLSYQIYIQRQLLEWGATLNKFLLQLVRAIAKIRVAGAEKRAFAKWGDDFSTQEALEYQVGRVENIVSTVSTVIYSLSSLAIYAMAIHVLDANPKDKPLTIGVLMGFFAAYSPFASAFSSVLGASLSLTALIPMWERARVILTSPIEVGVSKMDPGQLSGGIEVEHLHFQYPEETTIVLHDISFRVKPGECVAIVGYSGAGKSTLARLLVGFETPPQGQVFFDRKDLSTLNAEALRRQMGIILQNTAIFSGTIYDNIVCGRSCTPDEVEQAVNNAYFDNVLKDLPLGLHTILPSGGDTLSGGQRQRLLLARALLKKPKILILDEATSFLDNVAQERITHNLDALKVTRILIAQRLSTVRYAKHIYVLDNGTFVDNGTFAQLSKRKGVFQDLLKHQQL